ncbi:hypothetical protein B0H11DRAFT_2184418 [Mycena galericulata]|nr:hypothetical protein B0H11DRAFT_2184418 [Mycena galericulata]
MASPGKRIATINLTEENFRSTVKWEGEAIPNETVTEYDDLFRHPSGEVRVSHSDEGSGVTFHDVDTGTLIASSNFYDPTDGISFTDPQILSRGDNLELNTAYAVVVLACVQWCRHFDQ